MHSIDLLVPRVNSELCDDLQNIKNDIAYLSDIFTKFNEINLQLQGNDVNLIKVKSTTPPSCLSSSYSKET